ncbi:MAG: diguanylate cyclase [Deltaproteobacteria bacterium]|nr:diguanylate cyclase [Deltaproteobacteria bacterium]
MSEFTELRSRIFELEEAISKLKQLEDGLKKSEALYRTIFETTGTAMIVVEETMIISVANAEAESIVGYTKDEIVGKLKWIDLIVPEHREKLAEYHRMRRINPHAAPKSYESRVIARGGAVKDIMITVSVVPNTTRTIASFIDISERKRMEEQLRYLSTHDALTGLYNRAYFEEEMSRLERGRHFPVSILMIDVDRLKIINDSLGHAAGDDLLRRTAQVLKTVFRSEDVVARIGGDEFCVLLPMTKGHVAARIVARIKAALVVHNKQPSYSTSLSFSIGYATGDKGCSLTAVQNDADWNMYQEKLVGVYGENARK